MTEVRLSKSNSWHRSMTKRLLIGVLGHKNAGKSWTWKTLFGKTVKTSTRERKLWLSEAEWVNVFLLNGSPEEREIYVGKIINSESPSIVLCSMQYRSDVTQTINYFAEREYYLSIHWLNPGFCDDNQSEDYLNLMPYIHQLGYTLEIKDAKANPTLRVNEIRDFIHTWGGAKGLLNVAQATNIIFYSSSV